MSPETIRYIINYGFETLRIFHERNIFLLKKKKHNYAACLYKSHTSISVFQSKAHLNDLDTQLVIEVTYTEHL